MFPPTLGRVAAPAIDAARCTACGDCVGACPVAALAPQPGFSRRPHHAA
jgi:formate hydrogenlyase subunit 6/NADH:ubiquinone oxidoreductase subunit I